MHSLYRKSKVPRGLELRVSLHFLSVIVNCHCPVPSPADPEPKPVNLPPLSPPMRNKNCFLLRPLLSHSAPVLYYRLSVAVWIPDVPKSRDSKPQAPLLQTCSENS